MPWANPNKNHDSEEPCFSLNLKTGSVYPLAGLLGVRSLFNPQLVSQTATQIKISDFRACSGIWAPQAKATPMPTKNPPLTHRMLSPNVGISLPCLLLRPAGLVFYEASLEIGSTGSVYPELQGLAHGWECISFPICLWFSLLRWSATAYCRVRPCRRTGVGLRDLRRNRGRGRAGCRSLGRGAVVGSGDGLWGSGGFGRRVARGLAEEPEVFSRSSILTPIFGGVDYIASGRRSAIRMSAARYFVAPCFRLGFRLRGPAINVTVKDVESN